jgi:hypothetical protein
MISGTPCPIPAQLSILTDTYSQVTPEDVDKRAKELGVMSIETSAKAGHNVKALFKKIAMALPGGAEAKDATANQSRSSIVRWYGADGYRDRREYAWGGAGAGFWLFLLMSGSFVCILVVVPLLNTLSLLETSPDRVTCHW